MSRAYALIREALTARSSRAFDKAINQLLEAVKILRRELGPSEATADALGHLGSAYHAAAKSEKAITALKEALAMYRPLYEGGDSPRVASAQMNLGLAYEYLGREKKALVEEEAALAMFRRVFPGDHANTATSMDNVANLYVSLGRPEDALALRQEALGMVRRLFPGDHPQVVTVLMNLGRVYRALGRPQDAVPLLQEAVAMARRLFHRDHPLLLTTLGNLASALEDLGRPDKALPMLKEAADLGRRLYGTGRVELSTNLNNLAICYYHLGRVVEALPLLEESAEIARRTLRSDHPTIASLLGNLAMFLDALGRHERALAYGKEALDMWRRLYPGDHPKVAESLDNLGYTYEMLGRLDDSLPLKREALTMRRRLFPGDHPDVAQSLGTLASVYTDLGRYAEALPLQEESLAMRRRLFPEAHATVMKALLGIAISYESLQRHPEAAAALREAIEMGRQLQAPDVYKPLIRLSRILLAHGSAAEAVPLLREAVANLEGFRRVGKLLRPEERSIYMAQVQLWNPFPVLVQALLERDDVRGALSVLEQGQGRAMLDLLESGDVDPVTRAAALAGEAAGPHAAEAIRLAQEQVRKAESEVIVRAQASAAARKRRSLRDLRAANAATVRARRSVAEAQDCLHRLVAQALPEARPLSAKELQALLSPGERMLYYSLGDGQIGSYLFVVSPGDVQAHRLGRKRAAAPSEIEAAVSNYLQQLADGPPATDSAPDVLRRLLVPPPAWEQVRGAERVYIIAQGLLHKLPFEALVVDQKGGKKRYWLDDGPPVAYVDSGAILRWLRERHDRTEASGTGVSLLALGDPCFVGDPRREPNWPARGVLITAVVPGSQGARLGLRAGDVLVAYGSREISDAASLESAIGEGRPDDQVLLRVMRGPTELRVAARPGPLGIHVAVEPPRISGPALLQGRKQGSALRSARAGARKLVRLPGTRSEVEAVRHVFEKRGADKSQIVALLGAEATEAELASSISGARYVHLATHGIVDETETTSFSALALSMPLVPVPGDDGFLTFNDLLTRWRGRLSNARVVTLSACDTQKGTVRTGEGVFSLPLGFQFAGCPTVVGTLWKVSDESTPALMRSFYEHLLDHDGHDALGALLAAKRALRAAHPEPRTWAPFILIGDPR